MIILKHRIYTPVLLRDQSFLVFINDLSNNIKWYKSAGLRPQSEFEL